MKAVTNRRRFDATADPQAEDLTPRMGLSCHARGCTLRPSVSLDQGGRWMCFCHAFAPPHLWPQVTERLAEHGWFVDLIGDLQRMHTTGRDAEFRELAQRFWQDADPYMVPTASERTRLANYLYRLRAELCYRLGLGSQRPEPIEPKDWRAQARGAMAGQHVAETLQGVAA